MEKNHIEAEKDKLKKINDVFKLIKDKEIKMVDFRFTDLPGQWQHFSIPVDRSGATPYKQHPSAVLVGEPLEKRTFNAAR